MPPIIHPFDIRWIVPVCSGRTPSETANSSQDWFHTTVIAAEMQSGRYGSSPHALWTFRKSRNRETPTAWTNGGCPSPQSIVRTRPTPPASEEAIAGEAPGAAAATCYRHQCLVSTREIAGRLGLTTDQCRVSFQSRIGRAKWLRPATDLVIEGLPSVGVKHLAVACPGLKADNLEKLEEIGIRGTETFLHGGGESSTLLPCLNVDPIGVQGLASLCQGSQSEI